jgi:lipoyl(octanoyl) transferase
MTTDKTTWRLIVDAPASGAWNMAADEAILEQIGRGESMPTLRLYAWNPACLSLGYAQSFADVDTVRLHAHGWDVVRRPTGGRAILHTDELTYSVIAPLDEPRLAGSVLESYNRLAAALLAAVKSLGVPVELKEHQPGITSSVMGPVCFEVPSTYEITVSGKKLIGSAQARRKEGVLQHGTLPLFGDLTRIVETLTFSDETSRRTAAQKLLSRATTVEAALGNTVEWKTAAQAFVCAFETELNLELKKGEFSPAEKERAKQLMIEKYLNPEWTERT